MHRVCIVRCVTFCAASSMRVAATARSFLLTLVLLLGQAPSGISAEQNEKSGLSSNVVQANRDGLNRAERSATACVDQNKPGRLRLSRVESPVIKFTGPPAGVSYRWLRNMRNPAFCPFVLCHGSCSSVIGIYTIGGSCAPTQSPDEQVPCGLKVGWLTPASTKGCCSDSPGAVDDSTVDGGLPSPSSSHCH
jgi:hypothetical protein